MTLPSPFFRRGDQGVRSSADVDSPDFQKNTCVRDGYYAFTHTKLRRAKKLFYAIKITVYNSTKSKNNSHKAEKRGGLYG